MTIRTLFLEAIDSFSPPCITTIWEGQTMSRTLSTVAIFASRRSTTPIHGRTPAHDDDNSYPLSVVRSLAPLYYSLVLFGGSSSWHTSVIWHEMKPSWLVLTTCVVLVAVEAYGASPYFDDGGKFEKFVLFRN